MAENIKEIKTRIALKQQTYAQWTANTATGANYVPYYGEVCFCEIPAAPTAGNTEATTAPTVLFKVGNNTNKFSELKWASALAADVYEWAKLTWDEFQTRILPVITGAIAAGAELDETVAGNVKTINHETKLAGGFTGGATAGSATEAGKTVTIKVPKLTVNEYGHVTGASDVSYTITIPEAAAVNDGALTLKAGGGLSATQKQFTANDADNVTFEVSHGAKPTTGTEHTATAGTGRTYVTKVEVDNYGHIAKVYTATETDQTIPNITITDDTTAETPSTETVNVYKNLTASGHTLTEELVTVATKKAVDNALAAAKAYADGKPHENTSHTHSVGSGLKKTGDGGISGDVKYELNLKFGALKDNKLQLLDAADNTVVAEFDAAAFVEDSYLNEVTYEDENGDNILKFTFTLNDGTTKTVDVDLSHLVDVYTADETSITLTSSGDGKVFKIKESGVETKHIKDGNVTEAKLEQNVKTALGLARTALQSHQDISGKADKKVPAAAGNLASLDDNGNLADSGKKVSDFEVSGAVAGIFGYTTSGKNYALQKDANGKAFVNVPWTDTWKALSDSQDGYVSQNWYAPLNDWVSRFVKNSDGGPDVGYFVKDSFSVRRVYSGDGDYSNGTPYDYATLTPGSLALSEGDDSTYRSTTYAHRGIIQDINGENKYIALPEHGGLMAVIDENGYLGGDYDHEINKLVFGYDNYWAEIGKDGNGYGYLAVSDASSSAIASISATYGPTGISVNHLGDIGTFNFPTIDGEYEFVVAGSTEIVYYLNCN